MTRCKDQPRNIEYYILISVTQKSPCCEMLWTITRKLFSNLRLQWKAFSKVKHLLRFNCGCFQSNSQKYCQSHFSVKCFQSKFNFPIKLQTIALVFAFIYLIFFMKRVFKDNKKRRIALFGTRWIYSELPSLDNGTLNCDHLVNFSRPRNKND